MAEKDTPEFSNVELVAIRTGFYGNALRDVGTRFRFTGNKLPSWAVPVETAAKPAKAKPLNGDTKPKDAQAAVQHKAAEANGGSLA